MSPLIPPTEAHHDEGCSVTTDIKKLQVKKTFLLNIMFVTVLRLN